MLTRLLRHAVCGCIHVCADMAAARADAVVDAAAAHRYTMADLPRKFVFEQSAVTIGDFLGRGCFGDVHKGLLKGLPVCVKVRCLPVLVRSAVSVIRCAQINQILSNPLYREDPDFSEDCVIDDIIHEAVMLSHLHHDRILSFRGIVTDPVTNNPKYILFELASGSLDKHVEKLGRLLTLKECRRIGVDVLSALEYLAANNIVHRDLKPDNVLMFEDDDGHVTYKVGDVGLARFINSRIEAGSSRLSSVAPARYAALSKAGAPLYRAPEVTGLRFGPKADVFSFGVMMTELMAAKAIPDTPFPLKSFTSPYQLAPMCSFVHNWLSSDANRQPAFAALLRDCVEVDAARRPAASEALARLKVIVITGADGVPVSALIVETLRELMNNVVGSVGTGVRVVAVGLRFDSF